MGEKEKTIFYDGEDKVRIDTYLTKQKIFPSRSQVQDLITRKKIRVNDQAVKPGYRLKKRDKIDLLLPEPRELELKAEAIPLEIIYEDEDLIVVNKPAGMIVHPAGKICSGTLVNALLYHCRGSLSGIGGVIRPGIIHRLDKDTSGLLVAAKNDFAHLELSRQIKNRQITKKYIALVEGEVRDELGIIEAPIGRSLRDRKKMAVMGGEKSRSALTKFRVLKRFFHYTLLEVELYTGRTHQIRVHLSFIGYPVVGDKIYGRKKPELNIGRQALHSYILGFIHPSTQKYREFCAPLPEDLQELIDYLEKVKETG